MPGVEFKCSNLRIWDAAGVLLGCAQVDGCHIEGEVTYFAVIDDESSEYVFSLGNFRTFTGKVTFDTEDAKSLCMALVDD